MRTFDHALFAGGAIAALLAGVTTAKLGLAPLDRAIEAQAGPSLEATDPSGPPAIQANLSSDPRVSPPAVIVPVSASAPRKHHVDKAADPASMTDEAAQPAEDADVQEDAARDPAPELGPSSEAARDRDPSAPAVDPPADDSSTVAPS